MSEEQKEPTLWDRAWKTIPFFTAKSIPALFDFYTKTLGFKGRSIPLHRRKP